MINTAAKNKQLFYKLELDNFNVKFEVIERNSDTIISTISFKLEDKRTNTVKLTKLGDISRHINNETQKYFRQKSKSFKSFKNDFISIVDIAENLNNKIDESSRKRQNAFIEIYLYPRTPFFFTYLRKDEIKEIDENENIILEYLIFLEKTLKELKQKHEEIV